MWTGEDLERIEGTADVPVAPLWEVREDAEDCANSDEMGEGDDVVAESEEGVGG